jgi:phage gp29-like protein
MAAKKKAQAPTDRESSTLSGSVSLARKVSAANRWRSQYNPLRGLTLARAVALLEAYPRGSMADLQWTNFFIETTDADLLALVDRRTSAIMEMDWDIKIVPEAKRRTKSFDQKLADDQQAALQEAYDRIENLYELLAHLLLAKFRGFAHAEKVFTVGGDVKRFEIVDQWNMVRDGFNGDWKYNPEARMTMFDSLGDELLIDPADFIIREERRHIDRIALIKFIRTNLGQKDWDAFIEIFGLDSTIIIGPPNVPVEKEAEYESAARETSEGGGGYLPHGSDVKFANATRNQFPFRDYLEYLTEKLILAGTGGMLTMLTRSGSGTLAGDAHTETFEMLAKGDARAISEILQRQFDKSLLDAAFSGRPILAYFALAQNEETNPEQVVKDAAELAKAGYGMDVSELSEKTGYTLTERPPETIRVTDSLGGANPAAAAKKAKADLKNALKDKTPAERSAFLNSVDAPAKAAGTAAATGELVANAAPEFAAARARSLQSFGNAVAHFLSETGSSLVTGPSSLSAAQSLRDSLPDHLRRAARNPATAPVLADTYTAGFFNGIEEAAQKRQTA